MKFPAYVYMLFLGNNKYYVGMSATPELRFACHRSLLQRGVHPVEDLQADYNASPDKYLDYYILDTAETESERWKEHKWQVALRTYEREYGYNYKDPTARAERARAKEKTRCKTALKNRIRKAVYTH